MKYNITIPRNWYYRRGFMMTPGVYRVPEDLSYEMADRAVKEVSAIKDMPQRKAVRAAPENKGSGGAPNPFPQPVEGGDGGADSVGAVAVGTGRKRGSRKSAVPDDK